ncbi:hypothetical protein SAMN05216503_2904 [Polaribacter sp. KT25b]|uniref:hypothetical protein n=1 Tax=Polaribacter sp. KT25b TaxID=1855336 RepID=UPI00087AF099|nr:hypothetical protein [Polaribacter sp. KT25b]SDS38848.1 hypothetical protein SAMN05216503_2904 [Polaribacter sp. KT25b]
MINIYIGLSKNQISSYESIIREKKKTNCQNILISNKTLNNDVECWDKVVYAKESFNNQSSGKLSAFTNITLKIKQYKEIIKELTIYKTEQNITLYFTYIEDILTNFLLFSFNKNMRGIVVEDGTLNYYPHTIKSLSQKKVILKWMLSNLYNVRFKFYKGHSSGIEYENVVKQYVRVPELSQFPEKSVKLIYPTRKLNVTDTILIIGQEGYINQLGESRYINNLKDLGKLIQSKKYYSQIEKIYYKPHRNGKRIDLEQLKSLFLTKQVIYLESDEPLEDLYFNKLGSKYIYSFDSSALINIYLESEDVIKKELNFNVLLRYNNLLKPIFQKFNFNIYK